MLNLIPEWRSSWKFTSVQAGLALGFLDAVYAADFFGLQAKLDVTWFGFINAAVTFIVIPYLRNVQQSIAVPPQVKTEMKEAVHDLPTTKTEVARPPQVLSQGQFNALVDERVELKLHKPRSPRTKALAEKFTKGRS